MARTRKRAREVQPPASTNVHQMETCREFAWLSKMLRLPEAVWQPRHHAQPASGHEGAQPRPRRRRGL